MSKSALALPCVVTLLIACGGAPQPEAPETPDADDAVPTTDDARPADGIKRDADGDGNEDDTSRACSELTEKACKITMGCAWTDDGTCKGS